MKWNVDDIPVFLAVVEKAGITSAARELGMPKSTVSSTLSRLEQGLGLRLVDRNSRHLRITDEGEAFYNRAVQIMEQVLQTDAAMSELTAAPSGRLAVAVPPGFCNETLAPHLPEFRQQYPDIGLELVLTTRPVDLIREHVDMAVVVGPQHDSDMISRTLVEGALCWATTADYLSRNGLSPDLEDPLPHVQICERRYGIRRIRVEINGKPTHLDLSRGIIHVNDPLAVRTAILNGGGIAPLPGYYLHSPQVQGRLIQVCRHITFEPTSSKLTAIYPSRRLVPAKIRVFLEFLDRIVRQP